MLKGQRRQKGNQDANVETVQRPSGKAATGGASTSGPIAEPLSWVFQLANPRAAARRLSVGDPLVGTVHPGKILVSSPTLGPVGEVPGDLVSEIRRRSRGKTLTGKVLTQKGATADVELTAN